MEIRVIDCDAIVGFVDYGTIDSEKNGGWSTKMRCKKCGAAWLAENYINGIETSTTLLYDGNCMACDTCND